MYVYLTSDHSVLRALVEVSLDGAAVHGVAGLDAHLAGILLEKEAEILVQRLLGGKVELGTVHLALRAPPAHLPRLLVLLHVELTELIGFFLFDEATRGDLGVGREPLHVVVDPVDARLSDVRLIGKEGGRRDDRLERAGVARRRAAQAAQRVRVRVVVAALEHEVDGRTDGQVLLQRLEVLYLIGVAGHGELLVEADAQLVAQRYACAEEAHEDHDHDRAHIVVQQQRRVHVLEELVQERLGMLERLGTAAAAAAHSCFLSLCRAVRA